MIRRGRPHPKGRARRDCAGRSGELPPALRLLERRFAGNRVVDGVEHFDMDEAGQPVLPAEGGADAAAMLVDAGEEVGGDADVERPARPVGHDVDVAAPLHPASNGFT